MVRTLNYIMCYSLTLLNVFIIYNVVNWIVYSLWDENKWVMLMQEEIIESWSKQCIVIVPINTYIADICFMLLRIMHQNTQRKINNYITFQFIINHSLLAMSEFTSSSIAFNISRSSLQTCRICRADCRTAQDRDNCDLFFIFLSPSPRWPSVVFAKSPLPPPRVFTK